MAKYTMELRDIVEAYNVDIFDFDYEFYTDNDAIRERFEKMFIQTYYFHEIGFETIERFKLNLQATLNLNAPKYKQYWDSHLRTKDIDFAVNKDYTEEHIRELIIENESRGSYENDGNSTSSTKSKNTNTSRESAINDGVSKASLDDNMVTTVSKNDGEGSSDSVTGTKAVGVNNQVDSGSQKESYKTVGKGNIGATSSAQLIKEWRDIMLNLDKDIIRDCRDLFMLIY